MDQRRTATGARRSGDDYQDLVAAESFIRVLEHPSRYRWVKLEAKEAGKLDDVLVLRADGTVEATQVKFSRDALADNVAWSWQRLLDKKDEQANSLLQDWHDSVELLDVRYGRTVPRLVSNRRAGPDLFLTADGRVDADRTRPEVLAKVREQLGEATNDFLQRFAFQVNNQDHEDLEKLLIRRFEALGLSADNWFPFKDRIRAWIRGAALPDSGELDIDAIRSACGWRRLRPLPQGLEVPEDFTIPDPGFHANFIQQVKGGFGASLVLTAGPGVGKSTYLSFLVDELRNAEVPVARHHYSLSIVDDGEERLDARRVAESLMVEIAAALESDIESLGTQNLDPDAIRSWLTSVGEDLAADGRGIVVIVDGLDHVWRETRSNEALRKLFDQLLPPPDGVVIVVGTQPVEDIQLPPALLNQVPRKQWIELPHFDAGAIARWLLSHQDRVQPTPNEEQTVRVIRDVAAALHSKTSGHPLLMRFAIERIANDNEYLSEDSVAALPDMPTGTVEDYYRSLWVGLSEEGRDVAYLIATASFAWPQQGLLECLLLAGYERRSAAVGIAALSHLLAEDELGLASFHSSFLVFVRQQQGFGFRSLKLRQVAIQWLKDKAPEYWRRSHLWKMQLEAGDPNPLMEGSTREWAIEAIATGHPPDEVVDVLQEAAWTAIGRQDLSKYVDRGILADAVRGGTDNEDAYFWLLSAQLSLASDESIEARCLVKIAGLNDRFVVALARHLRAGGDLVGTRICFDEMVRRIRGRVQIGRWETDLLARARAVSELAGLIHFDPLKTAQFINQFESDDDRSVLFQGWVEGLRWVPAIDSSVAALDQPVGVRGGRCLSHHVAMTAVDQRVSLHQNSVDSLDPLYAAVYRMASEGSPGSTILDEPSSSRSADTLLLDQAERSFAGSIHDIFFYLVVRELQTPGFSESWRPAGAVRPWLMSAIRCVAQSAGRVAREWESGQALSVTAAFESTRSLSPRRAVHPLEDYESSAGLRRALLSITEDLLVLRDRQGGSSRLNWSEVEQIFSHEFSSGLDVLESCAKQDLSLDSGAVSGLSALVDEELSRTVSSFDDRAKAYSLLAVVSVQHEMLDRANKYLRRSAENLVAHGYHKDMVIHSALDAIEACGDRFSSRGSLWLGISPAIAAVDQFTDSDETGHLPSRLGSLLLAFDQELGVEYLSWLHDTEEFHDVEAVLNDIVRNGDLSDPVVRALAATCIDPESIYALEKRRDDASLKVEELLDLDPKYSATLADANTHSSSSPRFDLSPEDKKDKYLAYAPDQLREFIASEDLVWIPTRGEELCSWLIAWATTPRAIEALNAVEPYFKDDDRLRVSNYAVATVTEIAGKERSYDWLVWAQRTNSGWYEYWTSDAEAEERWDRVKHDFPDRWHRFLTESVRPAPGLSPHFGPTIARIVRYLLLFERLEEARAATSQVVATVSRLVSGQALPVPSWAQRLQDES